MEAIITSRASVQSVAPAIGDIVHYWDSWRGELTPHAAMVIALKYDGGYIVKLLVTSPNGNQFVARAEWSATPRKAHWSYR